MKEYKIQIRYESKFKGEWVPATTIFGGVWNPHPYTQKCAAEDGLARLRAQWEEKAPAYKREKPVEYRIVSREITEWEPI